MEKMKKMKEIENEKQTLIHEDDKRTETHEEETESESGSEEEDAKLETEKIRTKMERKLGSYHRHRLIFRPGGVLGRALGCRACGRLIEGPHYACRYRFLCGHVLHEFCYNLPAEVSNHPLHPKHELVLLEGPPQYPAECRVCGKLCKGATYHCMKCPKFDIELLCAWVPWTIGTGAHEHSFSLIPQPAIFSCNACNHELNNKTFSYMCFTCKFWVHLDCALGRHNEINLTHLLRDCALDNHRLDLLTLVHIKCELCKNETEGGSQGWSDSNGYGCSRCERYFHVGCVALATMSAKSATNQVPAYGSRFYRIARSLQNVNYRQLHDYIGRKFAHKLKGSLQIDHWSHQDHLLELGTSTSQIPRFDRSRIKCNGCKWPLMAPFYSCMECNFFLHVGCAELPKRIGAYIHSHRVGARHKHNLRIIISEEEKEGGENWCSNCSNPCSGFSYKCRSCEYRLDPSCAVIQEKIQHNSHEDPLYLLEDDKAYSKECNACGKSIEKKHTTYFCSICEFYLHIKCASLPMSSRHRFDHHELILMFKSAKNELGEYICDICEDENRNPKLWFYGCEECDFAAHVDCIRDQ